MTDIQNEDIIFACNLAVSMAEAAKLCEMPFSTFKRRAIALGVYNTNQAGIGIPKSSGTKIPLIEVLEGKHPQYQTYKLKHRLYAEGIKIPECTICGLGKTWNNKPIEHHLDHIDGNSTNHILSNLQILCPNCHSQTNTYCGKNKGYGKEI